MCWQTSMATQVSLITSCWQIHSQSPATTEVCQTCSGICAPLNPSAPRATDTSCFPCSDMDEKEGNRRKWSRWKPYSPRFFSLISLLPAYCCLAVAPVFLSFSLFPLTNQYIVELMSLVSFYRMTINYEMFLKCLHTGLSKCRTFIQYVPTW